MAILILEDDARTQETLCRLVKELSFEPIQFARDQLGNELAAYPSHLRLVLCEHAPRDGKSRELLGLLEKHPHLESVPVVWLVARGPRWLQSWWWRRQCPRVDDVLSKPFDREELASSMSRAYRRRVAACDTLLYLGDDGPVFRALEAWLDRSGSWRRLERFADAGQLEQAIRPIDGRLGAILIDPMIFPRFGKRGLHVARDGVVAQRAVVVALSRDPEAAAPIAAFCDRFVDPPASAAAWQRLLADLRRQLEQGWRSRLCLNGFKAAQKAKDERALRRQARRLSKLGPVPSSEAHTLLGQYYERRQRPARAIRHLEAALEINPFFPRTYLLLFKLYGETGAHGKGRALAERAARYCPHHRETQAQVAELRGST